MVSIGFEYVLQTFCKYDTGPGVACRVWFAYILLIPSFIHVIHVCTCWPVSSRSLIWSIFLSQCINQVHKKTSGTKHTLGPWLRVRQASCYRKIASASSLSVLLDCWVRSIFLRICKLGTSLEMLLIVIAPIEKINHSLDPERKHINHQGSSGSHSKRLTMLLKKVSALNCPSNVVVTYLALYMFVLIY